MAALGACSEKVGGGASDGREGAATARHEPKRSEPARAEMPLRLPRRGHPVVWVRDRRHVELRAAPGAGEVLREVGARTEFGSRTVFGVQRRRGRWVGVPTPFTGNDELAWIRLDPRRLKAGYTPYEIVVDLSDQAAELRRAHAVLRSFPVTIGAPGTETPVGRFSVTDTFRGDLNPAYGCCALALTARQVNVPSGWLGGDRIAIHGTPGAVGGASSHGCLRAADADMRLLLRRVRLGTPVLVRQ